MKKSLSDIAEVFTGFTVRNVAVNGGRRVALVQAKSIQSFYLHDLTSCSSILIEGERTKAYLKRGDVLLSSRGEYRAAVYDNADENVVASSTILIIRIVDQAFLPEYIAIFFMLPQTQKLLRQTTSSGVLESITKKDILQIMVPQLSLKQQEKIIRMYRFSRERQVLLAKKMTIELQIFDTILQTYF